jgi:hypothetical protein
MSPVMQFILLNFLANHETTSTSTRPSSKATTTTRQTTEVATQNRKTLSKSNTNSKIAQVLILFSSFANVQRKKDRECLFGKLKQN